MNETDQNKKPRPIAHFLLTMLGAMIAISALATAMPDARPIAAIIVGIGGLALYFKGAKIMPEVPRSAYIAIMMSAILALPSSMEERVPTERPVYKTAQNVQSDKEKAKEESSKQAVWNAASQEAIKRKLKDPRSAEFRNVFFSDKGGSPVTCGEVNSKNSYGGFAGFQRFVAAGNTNLAFLETEVDDFATVWNKLCAGK